MEKYIYDESNGLWYELEGDYYIPCLKLPDEEQVEIGIWGQRHLEYIKHHRKGFYTTLILDFKLNRSAFLFCLQRKIHIYNNLILRKEP